MQQWSPTIMAEIRNQAKVFLIDNLQVFNYFYFHNNLLIFFKFYFRSRNDGFLLYAALQSPHTKIVSGDLCRDAMFRLADPMLEKVFRNWQHPAQLKIVRIDSHARTGFQVFLQEPFKHSTIAQRNPVNGGRHIPYNDGSPRYSYQLPNNWLSLVPKSTGTPSQSCFC